ncbi:MAG: ATP-dependent helicase, partial [Thermoplasmata archaeon]|nr:ATP-dependent helicase [Thermoplasmata archaeon]
SFLSARLGESVGVHIDPYRIILEMPGYIDPKRIEDILKTTNPRALPKIIRTVVKNSSYFRWQFVRTAKKFGALRKGADVRGMSISRFINAYEGTPLMKDAVDKTIWEFIDLGNTARVLEAIQKGDIEVRITGLSPIGRRYGERGQQYILPVKPDAMTLGALKKRLEKETVALMCLYCKSKRRLSVKNVPKKVVCQNCGGVLIAAIPGHRDRGAAKPRAADLKSGKKEISRLYKNANLVMAHGKKAVLALMARGIGVDAAARILRKPHETEEEFLRDLLKAEVSYARTRRFWD